MSELNEAQGYAASLRQQAAWIDETVNATVPVHSRIDLSDIDTDELRAAADFIDRSALTWLSIETAPKDGTQVLLWAASWEMSWGIQIGSFCDERDCWQTSEGSVADNDEDFDPDAEVDEDEDFADDENLGPTHWMPLPPAPEAQP